jgi:hypothetical protein
MNVRGVLRIIEGGSLGFWCPGCKEMHCVSSSWSFNGDHDRPTFSPSVLVTSGHYVPLFRRGIDSCWCTYQAEEGEDPAPFKCQRCHSFVRDGQIQFLSDCTHELVGQTVPLSPPLTPKGDSNE